MKNKYLAGLLAFLLLFSLSFAPVLAVGNANENEEVLPAEELDEEKAAAPNQDVNLAPNARSAVLIDQDTGQILYEKNGNERYPPASITKVMSMLLIMEALDDGKIKLTDKVRTSEYAASMGGSQIFLESGEEMTVEDMLKGIAVASGNDATVAMAEYIAGSEENFVKMMNDRAAQLGLKNTRFANSNGLPAENHYSSAYDIAVMSKELLKYEEITKYTGLYQDYLRKNSEKPFWLVNTNKLVRFYDGVDGLKTGYTSEAKFCLTATAKRDNFRVVAVVMGEPNTKIRNAEVSKMLDYAFSQFTNTVLFKTGDPIASIPINKGDKTEIAVKAEHQYSILLKKGESPSAVRYEVVTNEEITAPIKKGDPIGKVIVYKEDEPFTEFALESPVDVAEASWWQLFIRSGKKIMFIDN